MVEAFYLITVFFLLGIAFWLSTGSDDDNGGGGLKEPVLIPIPIKKP